GLEPGVAAGVVRMPVGVQDHVEPPPVRSLQLGQDRVGVRRVDRGDEARCRIPDQEAVVVGQAGELADVEGHEESWQITVDAPYSGVMRRSVHELRAFYGEPVGALVHRSVARRLSDAWGDAPGLDVLG